MLEVVWEGNTCTRVLAAIIPNSPELGHSERRMDKLDIYTVGHLLSNTKG